MFLLSSKTTQTPQLRSTQLVRKNDSFGPVKEDTVLKVRPDSARENPPLYVSSFSDEILGSIPVTYPLHVLFDDRSLIEICGDVMRSGAD